MTEQSKWNVLIEVEEDGEVVPYPYENISAANVKEAKEKALDDLDKGAMIRSIWAWPAQVNAESGAADPESATFCGIGCLLLIVAVVLVAIAYSLWDNGGCNPGTICQEILSSW